MQQRETISAATNRIGVPTQTQCSLDAMPERNHQQRVLPHMDLSGKHALEQLELAEAELAVLKQEQVLRELLNAGEPTAEATGRLRQLRDVAERLSAQKKDAPRCDASTGKGNRNADHAA